MAFESFCNKFIMSHKNPANLVLHIIAAVIIIYGLWMHDLGLILIGILIGVIGHIIAAIKDKKSETRKPVAKKRSSRRR
jgi:hypothetical protein